MDMDLKLKVCRINLRRFLLLGGLMAVFQCSGSESVAEELTLPGIPALESVTRFSAQGSSFSILGEYQNRGVDPCRLAVVDLKSGKVIRFSDKLFTGPAMFFDNGSRFLTATFLKTDGPTTYTAHDMAGNELATLTTEALVRPTRTGQYFFSIFSLINMTRPTVYDDQMILLRQFGEEDQVGVDWNAGIIQDSFYVLRVGDELRVYSLPALQQVSVFSLSFGKGSPLKELYCSGAGSLCAVSNFETVNVIDMITGAKRVQTVDAIRRVLFSPDGILFAALSARSGIVKTEWFAFNTGTPAGSGIFDLQEHAIGLRRVQLGQVSITPHCLLLNYTASFGVPPNTSRSIGSIIVSYKLGDEGLVAMGDPRMLDGPSWSVREDAFSTVYNLSRHDQGNTLVKTVKWEEVSRE